MTEESRRRRSRGTAESVAATRWREWWDAVSAGALVAVSVILAVIIWAKPLPDASPPRAATGVLVRTFERMSEGRGMMDA
ncbi:hypothetical protein [Microbacterium hominis]|uniref:hypothetical protein n=1 Tax=Microbacterium hominis TaxID=162426 RepID=UPI0007684F79|nr:hypothetical protein [Microbacterium hominis]KXC05349.1 hypothetical protein MhomT_11525 [Microbacterium hominis]